MSTTAQPTPLTDERWETIAKRLKTPFKPERVKFRPQGTAGSDGKVTVLAYIDARAVMDRLDEAVGPGNWSFELRPVPGMNTAMMGALTIHGVTKMDMGDAGDIEKEKSMASGALKRAAVQWGVGRYLYGLGNQRAATSERGFISDAELGRLRSRLPRPDVDPTTLPDFEVSDEADEAEGTPRPAPIAAPKVAPVAEKSAEQGADPRAGVTDDLIARVKGKFKAPVEVTLEVAGQVHTAIVTPQEFGPYVAAQYKAPAGTKGSVWINGLMTKADADDFLARHHELLTRFVNERDAGKIAALVAKKVATKADAADPDGPPTPEAKAALKGLMADVADMFTEIGVFDIATGAFLRDDDGDLVTKKGAKASEAVRKQVAAYLEDQGEAGGWPGIDDATAAQVQMAHDALAGIVQHVYAAKDEDVATARAAMDGEITARAEAALKAS